jgi:hypothetical protein
MVENLIEFPTNKAAEEAEILGGSKEATLCCLNPRTFK